MKNRIILTLLAGILLAGQSCNEPEDGFAIPEGMQILSHVNTYYENHMVVDTFYYDSHYELTRLDRRDGDLESQFYFEHKKLSEGKVMIKEEGQAVSYSISYMNDGKMSVSKNTRAYILSESESGYYTLLTCYTREPFEEWDETYFCEFSWENGNMKSRCVNREKTYYYYDDKPNPMAGYIVWGFFVDDLYLGTTNNRIDTGYQYEYDELGYPVRLIAPGYVREYFYN